MHQAQLSFFWIFAHALRAFVDDAANTLRVLPLSGALPDMTATSDGYVALATMYKKKAEEDVEKVRFGKQ